MQKRSSDHKYFPKLKRARQRTDSHCGPAVIQMLASFVGVRISQLRVVQIVKAEKRIKEHGTIIADFSKATKKLVPNSIFWYKEKSTISDLDKIVNKYKYPVGVEWQGVFRKDTDKNFPDDGHYSVVVHVNKGKNKIFIADPFRDFWNLDREFEIDFFKKRWWDFNEIKMPKLKKLKVVKDVRMMFLITPKDATFPKTLGMKTS